jgi:hypothetical protein
LNHFDVRSSNCTNQTETKQNKKQYIMIINLQVLCSLMIICIGFVFDV